jgi:predicted nucleic acid-binding protein
MSGIRYLADTNAFIYLLEGNELILQLAQFDWAFSYITEIELLAKKNISEAEEIMIRALLKRCKRINHNQEITQEAINIRRKCGLKLPDAIIAACGLVFDLPIVTADVAFSKVNELDVILIQP